MQPFRANLTSSRVSKPAFCEEQLVVTSPMYQSPTFTVTMGMSINKKHTFVVPIHLNFFAYEKVGKMMGVSTSRMFLKFSITRD